jgi:hypothetical protein
MIGSPSNLELLLHCYYSPEPHPRYHAPAIQEGLKHLLDHKMISGDGNIFHTTPKGEAFIKHLMTIPFPVTTYKIPDQPERIPPDGQ